MTETTFDEVDQRILGILQIDSNIPIAEIAQQVALSPTPVWRRIKRMEAAGLIRARVALVDQKLVNVPMTIFIGVTAPRHAMEWFKRFQALIEDIPEVVEAYRLTGATDYIMKVVVPDIDAYDVVYQRMINEVEFTTVNSSISMEELKFTTAVPTKYL
ncbi:Lrp/AsnC family transcriptional regulator [Pacificibacter marinus]|uniref:Lrp/AsnC family transcriptional regulator n=1 Tax=Pacificibacter marinus TaxID=658057 RepID=UPI001C07EC9D|nr:Lrp/AsnC family transcriptional regulator [Pacificibacter marinus]MBU2867554.1 Lrp/AsnC family transcriptional regulator [Pacificibacter marinus]